MSFVPCTWPITPPLLPRPHQVLKKRDEENTVTISQQKRRLTRLQDTLNTLHTRLTQQEKSQRAELSSLMEEFRRNTEQYRELQKKVKHFRQSDTQRFYAIWRMNEERVGLLAEEVLNADQVIHQQQLGLQWERPCLPESPVTRASSPSAARPTNTSLSQATLYASQVLSHTESEGAPEEVGGAQPPSYPTPLVRRVLEMLCVEAEFLIESKLLHLLAPLEHEEQMLMRLDSMFSALHIETEADIHKLVKCFLKEGPDEGAGPDRANVTLIHPNDVPQVLRKFVEQRQASSSKNTAASLPSRLLEPQASHGELLDGSFWGQTAAVPHESHERVWQALLEALEGYHNTLTARGKLIAETEALHQQNTELRLLLHQYMQARINRELEVPPTVVLPTRDTAAQQVA